MLVELVDALAARAGVPERCQAVTDALGRETMVDAVAVYANFTMMTRIADGTGTPLDDGSVEMSAGLRADLAINEWTSTRLTV